MIAAELVTMLRDWALAVGAVSGALVAIAAALRLPLIGRPLRYVARHLILLPLLALLYAGLDASPVLVEIRERLRRHEEDMAAVRSELTRNDGSSIKDSVDRIEDRLSERGEAMAAIRAQLCADGDRLARIEGRLAAGDDAFAAVASRLGSIEEAVTTPTP